MGPNLEIPIVLVELRRYKTFLIDGGPEALAGLWAQATEGLAADAVAEFVAERMSENDEAVGPYRRVLHPKLRVGRSPLLAALHRHSDELRAGSVDHLFRLWNIELRRMTPAQIAGEISRRLCTETYAEYRRTNDPSEVALDRVYLVLSRFQSDLIPTAVADLTRIWGAELIRFERLSDVIEQAVRRLSSPSFIGFLKPGVKLPRTGEEALRAALLRYPDLVPCTRVDATFEALKPLYVHLPPERVAGLVAAKLGAEN